MRNAHPLLYGIVFFVFLTGGPALGDETLWQERSEEVAPVLPRGYSPLPSLSGLIKELKPAVVNIHTTQVIKPRMRRSRFYRDPLLEEFFGLPRGDRKFPSLGSGFSFT